MEIYVLEKNNKNRRNFDGNDFRNVNGDTDVSCHTEPDNSLCIICIYLTQQEMESVTRIQILDDTVSVSLRTNAIKQESARSFSTYE